MLFVRDDVVLNFFSMPDELALLTVRPHALHEVQSGEKRRGDERSASVPEIDKRTKAVTAWLLTDDVAELFPNLL